MGEIKSLDGHGEFLRVLSEGGHGDGVSIDFRFAYTTKCNPLEEGRKKRYHMFLIEEGYMLVFTRNGIGNLVVNIALRRQRAYKV